MKTSHIILLSLSAITLPIRMSAAYSETPDSMDLILNEVVVTGSHQAVSRDLTPYTVSVVSHRQLEATGQTQVLSAISGQGPSLFVTQRSIIGFGVSNGGSGHIKMRGVGGDRASGVLMMVVSLSLPGSIPIM